MACTTLLVGKNASYDGSTMIARNDDSGSGHFTAKKFVVVQPEEHPAVYRSVLLHGAMDIASMLVGGLYGTEDVAESISGYDASMMLSILIYLIPTLFLLRKKKIGEVALYFGRDCAPAAAPAPEENGERLW